MFVIGYPSYDHSSLSWFIVMMIVIKTLWWWNVLTINLILSELFTAWKVSKYGVFSGPYSVRILENTDQKNSEYEHFSRSVAFSLSNHSYRNFLFSKSFFKDITNKVMFSSGHAFGIWFKFQQKPFYDPDISR